jgi:hypothetical protein
MTPTPSTPTKAFRTFKEFTDACAQLRTLAIYPVCWDGDTFVYRTQLRATQARGYTCVLCDARPGDDDTGAFVRIGYVVDTDGCGDLYQHLTCPNGDTHP